MVNGVKGPSVIRFEDVVSFYLFYGFTCIFRIFYVTLFTSSYFCFKDNGYPYPTYFYENNLCFYKFIINYGIFVNVCFSKNLYV